MVEKHETKQGGAGVTDTDKKSRVSDWKDKLVCHGKVCFTENGIEIRISADSNPKCAKRLSEAMYEDGKEVRFVLEKAQISKVEE